MIFTAYEISKEPIEEDDYLTEDSCYDYLDKYNFDYCKDADCDDRLSDIEHFPAIFPKGMFTKVGENSFRYNGGLEKWKVSYCIKLKALAADLSTEGVLKDTTLYRIKSLIENPLGDYMFYFGESFPSLYRGDSVMRLLISNLKVGDIIYIGGVVYFHY